MSKTNHETRGAAEFRWPQPYHLNMNRAGNLDVTYEQMRSLVVAVLVKGDVGQIAYLRTLVAEAAIKQGLLADPSKATQGFGPQVIRLGATGSDVSLSDYDYGRVHDIVWDLMFEGILRPGLGDGQNRELPFFHLTDWGKAALAEGP